MLSGVFFTFSIHIIGPPSKIQRYNKLGLLSIIQQVVLLSILMLCSVFFTFSITYQWSCLGGNGTCGQLHWGGMLTNIHWNLDWMSSWPSVLMSAYPYVLMSLLVRYVTGPGWTHDEFVSLTWLTLLPLQVDWMTSQEKLKELEIPLHLKEELQTFF